MEENDSCRRVVGVISDTHGLLRCEAIRALKGSDLILHTGDVGTRSILYRLQELAPTRAVRGNVDQGSLAEELPATTQLEIGNCQLYLLHDLERLNLDPVAAGIDAVLFGHSHCPSSTRRGPVLYFNPGSAGPRRSGLPVSVGRLVIRGRQIEVEHILLGP